MGKHVVAALFALCLGALLMLAACSGDSDSEPDATGSEQAATSPSESEEEPIMTLAITSPAFTHEAAIPAQFTCQGDDISPALAWSGAPDGTQSWALIMDDPDAPGRTWDHWILYNLPAPLSGLPQGVTSDADLSGGVQGRNSWGRNAYGGPCPPSGTHRYFFTLYALDSTLNLSPGATKADVHAAMEGHILAESQLMGTYQKS